MGGLLEAQQAAQVDLAGQLGGHVGVAFEQSTVIALGRSLQVTAWAKRVQGQKCDVADSMRECFVPMYVCVCVGRGGGGCA